MDKIEQLLKDAGLSDDEIKSTVSAFDPKALEALNKGTMRQSDYSRSMDELRTQKQGLESERKELLERWNKANDEYQSMLTDWQSSQAERDEAKKKLAEAEEKLKTASVDPSKLMEEVQKQITGKLGEFAAGSTAYMGDILEIADEHRELFGKRISPSELMQKAAEAKKTPMDYWRETYKVDDRRKELADKADMERLEAVRKEAYDKALQDFNKPPGAGESKDSPTPFYESKKEGSSPWDDVGPSEAENQLLAEIGRVGR